MPARASAPASVPVVGRCRTRAEPGRAVAVGVAVGSGVAVGVAVAVAVGVGVGLGVAVGVGFGFGPKPAGGSAESGGTSAMPWAPAPAGAASARSSDPVRAIRRTVGSIAANPRAEPGWMGRVTTFAGMEASVPPRARLAALRRSESAAAALLAVATIVQQGAAIVFTVVFTRVLGTDGYGALAALTNFTVIMLVPGSALQVAVARRGTLGRLGGGPELAATLRRWTTRLLGLLLAVSVVAAVLREPLAGLVNVDETWGAAAVPATATLWLLVCVQRGLLLSAGAYKGVAASLAAEGVGRILVALVLAAVGLGVTGAYLGLGLAYGLIALVLAAVLARRLGPAPAPSRPHPSRPHPSRPRPSRPHPGRPRPGVAEVDRIRCGQPPPPPGGGRRTGP